MAESGRGQGVPPVSPWLSRRLVEWSALALVVMTLVWVFGRQMQTVQAQSERLAVRFTLKILREAMLLEQILKRAQPTTTAATGTATRNPFALLDSLPANFAGEVASSKADSIVPGNWVFDPECACVGYRLLYPQWLEPEQFADVIWFRLSPAPGEVRLIAQARYVWLDQPLN
ncbi:MAG: hypothetical protein WCH60_11540 [Burkholderiales bacterium]